MLSGVDFSKNVSLAPFRRRNAAYVADAEAHTVHVLKLDALGSAAPPAEAAAAPLELGWTGGAGARIDARDRDGRSAEDVAAELGRQSVLELLRDARRAKGEL